MPIDFSDTEDVFIGFEGSSFAMVDDPEDAGNDVGEFSNNGAVAAQGAYLDLDRTIDLGFQQRITLNFYAFDAGGHQVTLKLEQGSEPDVEVVRTVAAQGWTTGVVFDFANARQTSDGSTVNATGEYSRIVFLIDAETALAGTFLIDDIDDGTVGSDPDELDVIYDSLVWSDEFSIDGAIDDTNWFAQTQLPPAGNGSWFNGEVQHYTNRLDNSYVEDGFLHIVAKREDFTDQGETKAFTSARLNSKYAFTYGRVDVRAKLPLGNGTWPAIWTLGKNISEPGAYWETIGFGTTSWPACGEIDIMEHGLGAVNHVSSAIHTPSSFGNTVNTRSIEISDVAENFHIYSVNWSSNQITFLVDNVPYYTYNPSFKDANTWPFDLEQYLILNVAIGGISGNIDASFTESDMVIDYVRVYQESPGDPSESDPLTTSELGNSSVSIYPNPAVDAITVRSEQGPIDQLILFDFQGKEVLRKKVSLSEQQLDLSTLTAGIYFLNLSIPGEVSVHKLVLK